jgi:hypothetical protein
MSGRSAKSLTNKKKKMFMFTFLDSEQKLNGIKRYFITKNIVRVINRFCILRKAEALSLISRCTSSKLTQVLHGFSQPSGNCWVIA